jgi:D-alanyl-D-alanine carboxypeptidase/D-alanyl-D-alanine-endopeptidase (penicillin-binding protein 4)
MLSLRRLPSALVLGIALGSAAFAPPAHADPPLPAASAAIPAVDKAPIDDAIQRLAADVQRWGGTLSVHVVDVGTGATLAALDEGRALNPASNAKLATAAAALRVLGAQHRFQTGLYGRIDGDTMGELVLRGDGDPSLRTADLWAMASELRSSGVRHVKAIVVDQSYFDDAYVPPAFEQQPGEWATFRAPVAAVSLNENTVAFSILASTQGKDAHVDVDPPGFVELSGSITTSRASDPEKATVGLEGRGTRIAARLVGSVPENGRVVRLLRRVDDPHLLAGLALRTVLKEVGVDVRGATVKRGGEGQKKILVTHRSASLGELLSALGKDSDNFYAEMLLKAIGAKAKGRPASAAGGAEGVVQALADLGVNDAGLVVKNGSGLFDANRISAAATTRLLRAMIRDPGAGPEYLAQLSVGGADGTLRHRFREWETTGAIRAKTGTLDAVAALSGYVLPPPGRGAVVYSVLVNGIPGKVAAARGSMDRIVDAVAREVWKGVLPAEVQGATTAHP